MTMLYEYRKRDGTSKFLAFPECPIIRTFVNSNKNLSPLSVRINGCILAKNHIDCICLFSTNFSMVREVSTDTVDLCP